MRPASGITFTTGYAPDYRVLPAAVAATHNMSREEALSVLRKYATAREPILVAVYEYWKNKRERWGKPFMRRLQVGLGSGV